jgi:hypothetical protein
MAKRDSKIDRAQALQARREYAEWILAGCPEDQRVNRKQPFLPHPDPPTSAEKETARETLKMCSEQLVSLKEKAIDLWKKDETNARVLGETLLAIKKLMVEHGDFGKWWRREKLDQNRVSYCMRLAEGKVAESKAKAKTSPRTKALLTITKKLRKLYDLAEGGDIQRAKDLLKEIDAEIEQRFFRKPVEVAKAAAASAGA